jgi:hypothetical protein
MCLAPWNVRGLRNLVFRCTSRHFALRHSTNDPAVKLQILFSGVKLKKQTVTFQVADKCGVRGGTEHAMMSTTLDRSVALQCAGQELPTICEIQLGFIDR